MAGHYYLTTYAGRGTELDPFVPRGRDQANSWAAIDLRPNGTIANGYALMYLPVRADSPRRHYLGDDPNILSRTTKDTLEARLGITISARSLRLAIPEMLITHARTDGSRWRPLRPSIRRRQYEIRLGELMWTAPVIAGGSTLQETWPTDGDSIATGQDQTWKEILGDIDVASNVATAQTNQENYARCEDTLATDDMIVQSVIPSASVGTSILARCNTPGTDTAANSSFYMFRYSGGDWQLYVRDDGSFTLLDSATEAEPTPSYTISLETDGSSISGVLVGTGEKVSATNTAISGNQKIGIRGYDPNGDWGQVDAEDLSAGFAYSQAVIVG